MIGARRSLRINLHIVYVRPSVVPIIKSVPILEANRDIRPPERAKIDCRVPPSQVPQIIAFVRIGRIHVPKNEQAIDLDVKTVILVAKVAVLIVSEDVIPKQQFGRSRRWDKDNLLHPCAAYRHALSALIGRVSQKGG